MCVFILVTNKVNDWVWKSNRDWLETKWT